MTRARETHVGGRLPIVARTAHARDAAKHECLSDRMDGYLSKPVRPEELEKAVGTWAHRPGGPIYPSPKTSAPYEASVS